MSIPDSRGPVLHRLPLLVPSFGWLCGLAAARTDIVPFYLLGVAALLLLAALLLRYRRAFAAMVLAGIVWGSASLFWDAYLAGYDTSWLDGRQIVTATVGEVDDSRDLSARLRLEQIIRNDGMKLPGKVDVYMYGRSASAMPRAGQRVSASVRLHPPSNRLNPGAFDYRTYCFDRHIALIGSANDVRVVADQRSWLQLARERIVRNLPNRDGSGVVRALLLAERNAIPVEIQDAFAASGAAHLLAISGLHVGMVAGWVFFIVWWLLTRREAWIVAVPVRKVALLMGLIAAAVYTTLAGWPLPAQRAIVMLAAAVLSWWLRSRAEPLNTMLAALMLLLLIDPAAVVSISLWLSFAAVAALLLWMEGGMGHAAGRGGVRQWGLALFWVSLVATLATLPIVTDLFGRIPTYSLIANLLLVPLYSLIVLPLSLLGEMLAIVGSAASATFCFDMAATVIEACNDLLLTIHGWPAGNLWVADVPLWAGILYAAGAALAIRYLLLQKRRAAAVTMASTLGLYLLLAVPERFPDLPTMAIWDVGQGAASSLVLPDGRVMVVDLPGRSGSRYNGGTDVAAGLRSVGVAHADVLVLSHAQSDHAGGAERLVSALRDVHELWLADVPDNRGYRPMQIAAVLIEHQGGAVRWLKQGDRLSLGDAEIEVLWPPAGYRPANGNNDSLVLSVELSGSRKILLPADVERGVEEQLAGELVAYDVALLPHHGSRTSSSEAWVKAVSPKIGVAQTGKGNRYHFPAGAVIERYRRVGSQLFDTKNGAVFIRFNGDSGGMTAEQFRVSHSSKREMALRWVMRHL